MEKQTQPAWLPTTLKEIEIRGWEWIDVILFTGDAYIDHPSFGAAVIGRVLEHAGMRVAIIPQPNWRDDLRDFRKLGAPRLFFGVTAGAMDSMVNHYTANKRLRSDDAYTPDGRTQMRPDYPTITYTQILKKLFPEVPVVIGGIEASMRRLTHYDYWQDGIKPSILAESGADILIYGMGERSILELSRRLSRGEKIGEIVDLPQSVVLRPLDEQPRASSGDLLLASHQECLTDAKVRAENITIIERESNRLAPARLWQRIGNQVLRVNAPYPLMQTPEMDSIYDLPYTRLPHPKYKNKTIPAYEMIRHSVTLHRGCFGGCSFCTISAHQGKFITSRSKASILNEVKAITQMPDFKGYISDLGGPSANMYKMGGVRLEMCKKCERPSCLYPEVCTNLHTDHTPLIELYRAVDQVNGVKKSFVGSGVRYDLLLHRHKNEAVNESLKTYAHELITKHVSGRLKVAPEHTNPEVLHLMRKPSFRRFEEFKRLFERINEEEGLRQQLVPYFISSHPGCTETMMAELAAQTKGLNLQLEQVQDFTPTPMTLSTEMYSLKQNPYSSERVVVAHTKEEKLAQRQYFFWYKPEMKQAILQSLQRLKRLDLIEKLYPKPHTQKGRRA